MAAYTQEQIDLINDIRRLRALDEEGKLNTDGSIHYGVQQDRAKSQNLCWW